MVILSLPNITGRSMTNQGYGKWCSLKKKVPRVVFRGPFAVACHSFFRPYLPSICALNAIRSCKKT